MGSPDISHPIKVLAACCVYEPGVTTCCWIDTDEHIHTESFHAAEGEDPPVFQLIKKEGVSVQFNMGSYSIAHDPVRAKEPVL